MWCHRHDFDQSANWYTHLDHLWWSLPFGLLAGLLPDTILLGCLSRHRPLLPQLQHQTGYFPSIVRDGATTLQANVEWTILDWTLPFASRCHPGLGRSHWQMRGSCLVFGCFFFHLYYFLKICICTYLYRQILGVCIWRHQKLSQPSVDALQFPF